MTSRVDSPLGVAEEDEIRGEIERIEIAPRDWSAARPAGAARRGSRPPRPAAAGGGSARSRGRPRRRRPARCRRRTPVARSPAGPRCPRQGGRSRVTSWTKQPARSSRDEIVELGEAVDLSRPDRRPRPVPRPSRAQQRRHRARRQRMRHRLEKAVAASAVVEGFDLEWHRRRPMASLSKRQAR